MASIFTGKAGIDVDLTGTAEEALASIEAYGIFVIMLCIIVILMDINSNCVILSHILFFIFSPSLLHLEDFYGILVAAHYS